MKLIDINNLIKKKYIKKSLSKNVCEYFQLTVIFTCGLNIHHERDNSVVINQINRHLKFFILFLTKTLISVSGHRLLFGTDDKIEGL